MTSLGEIIRGLSKLADEGYIFTEKDKSYLLKLANSLDSTERKVLSGVLKDLGVELEINDKLIAKSIVKSWTSLAETGREEYGYDEVIRSLEYLYELDNPTDDYPISLKEDTTVAGMLYKGDDRYNTLLSYFRPSIAANVYLVHYKHKLKSIKAFYTLMSVFKDRDEVIPYRVLLNIFNKMSQQRIFGFLTRMKSNALGVLGESKCKELGTLIFLSWYEFLKRVVPSINEVSFSSLYTNEILHLVCILGLDTEEIDRTTRGSISPELIINLLKLYEVSKPLCMKYKGVGIFDVPDDVLVNIFYPEIYPMYPSIVGEEGERLYREFYEYVRQIRSEYE